MDEVIQKRKEVIDLQSLRAMEVKKMRTTTAMIYTTLRCNLHCPHCGQKNATPEAKAAPDLKLHDFELFIRDIARDKLPIRTVTFTGGEPTLWGALLPAIVFAHNYGLRTKVFSNGIRRSARDYGIANTVEITNYGSINANDRLRLKHQLGRRMRTFSSVQVPIPQGNPEECLPAKCACCHVSLFAGRVFACPSLALRGDIHAGLPIQSNRKWAAAIMAQDVLNSPVCTFCLANELIRRPVSPPLTCEAFLWESSKHILWSSKWRGTWLRALNRRILRLRGRK